MNPLQNLIKVRLAKKNTYQLTLRRLTQTQLDHLVPIIAKELEAMSTNDVPGANPANQDELKAGCWAEADGGRSLVYVLSTENNNVVFEMFDLSQQPPLNYRHSMPKVSFESTFSWKLGSVNPRWVWHDKTPFDWNRIVQAGAPDGASVKSADQIMSAAQRVAENLRIQGVEFLGRNYQHQANQTVPAADNTAAQIWDKLSRALNAGIRELGR